MQQDMHLHDMSLRVFHLSRLPGTRKHLLRERVNEGGGRYNSRTEATEIAETKLAPRGQAGLNERRGASGRRGSTMGGLRGSIVMGRAREEISIARAPEGKRGGWTVQGGERLMPRGDVCWRHFCLVSLR